MTKNKTLIENGNGSNVEQNPKENRKRTADKTAEEQTKDRFGERKEKRVKEDKMTKLSGRPKKNQSPYAIWRNANYEGMMKVEPGLTKKEWFKKAGEKWKKVEDKSEWNTKANEDKARYIEELKGWKSKGGEEALPATTIKAKEEQGANISKKPKKIQIIQKK